MTETDATKRPLNVPERFIPYFEKHRIYKLFKDMLADLVVNLPKDHLKHMKIYFHKRIPSQRDTENIILLVSPELKIDIEKLVKALMKDLGTAIITRRYIMDLYKKHDDYVPGCVSPALMSMVTRKLTLKDPVPFAGWLMFDHPCTIREARCLQQEGVLPTVTLVLMPPPPRAPPSEDNHTPARTFYDQDYEGLKFAYKATVKEVYVYLNDDIEKISSKCFNAVHACMAGAQGTGQGHHIVGAPAVYRVLLLGPRGSGRRCQAQALAKHFGLVYLFYDDVFAEAMLKKDDIGEKLRNFGNSIQLKAKIVNRRILQNDCMDRGWVLTGYPTTGTDFEFLERMKTPPNRVLILNVDIETCKMRVEARRVDWCTAHVTAADHPRARRHPDDDTAEVDNQLDFYFSEALPELRAASGPTVIEIDGNGTVDEVQTKIRAAVIAAPAVNIEYCKQIKEARCY